jgi:hypothetical protein
MQRFKVFISIMPHCPNTLNKFFICPSVEMYTHLNDSLKAANVLKLKSYWFKDSKSLVLQQKNFRNGQVAHK